MKLFKIIFSPTGGTKKVADIIGNEVNHPVKNIDLTKREDFSKFKIDNQDLVLIALPSYGGRVPEIAAKRLREINGAGANTILITTYGNRDYEDTLIELYDISLERNFNPIAAITAISEHSILPQYATNRPDKEDQTELKQFIKRIKEKNSDSLVNVPGNRPYKKITNLPLKPKPTKNCNACKACFFFCPVEAIDKNSLKTNKNCISCMRCIKVCPNSARKINKLLTSIAAFALKKEASERKDNELFI